MDSDISSMIQKIMQNPEFSNMVKELRGEMGNNAQSVDASKSTEDTTADMMAKLPDVMAMLSPIIGKSESTSSSENNNDIIPKKYDKAKAEKLLFAIKPYLNGTRSDIIDKCVSVMQLSDVMGTLGGLDSLMKSGNKGEGGT